MLSLKRTNSENADFKTLVASLDRDLWDRYNDLQSQYVEHNVLNFIETVVIAYQDAMPIGIACFKKIDSDTVEIKRMYVSPEGRGNGIAYAILKELEAWAKDSGFNASVLETGTLQPEAINLYKKAGYSITENYEPYVGMSESICFRKNI